MSSAPGYSAVADAVVHCERSRSTSRYCCGRSSPPASPSSGRTRASDDRARSPVEGTTSQPDYEPDTSRASRSTISSTSSSCSSPIQRLKLRAGRSGDGPMTRRRETPPAVPAARPAASRNDLVQRRRRADGGDARRRAEAAAISSAAIVARWDTPISTTTVPPTRASARQSTSGSPARPCPVTTVNTGPRRVGDGHAGGGRGGDRRRHAGHHLDGNAGVEQRLGFLAAAAEHERVSALEPDDAAAGASELDEQCRDQLLRYRPAGRLPTSIGSASEGTRSSTPDRPGRLDDDLGRRGRPPGQSTAQGHRDPPRRAQPTSRRRGPGFWADSSGFRDDPRPEKDRAQMVAAQHRRRTPVRAATSPRSRCRSTRAQSPTIRRPARSA